MADFTSAIGSTVVFLFEEGGQSPIGTGFIVGYPLPDRAGMEVPLVVTAKHVVGDREKIVGRFSPRSGTEPAHVLYDLAASRRSGDVWEHPDEGVDVLVFRTLHFEKTEYLTFPLSGIASRKTYSEEEIKATDRVIFPGLLLSFMGTARNYPVFRDGSIALIPDEPVPLTYDVGGKRVSTKQEVLLVDGRSIPGASGSPVFLWPGPRLKGGAFHIGGTTAWLLGIMHGFYPAQPREVVGVEVTKVIPAFAEHSGIAIVFPSWRLLEILERDEVVKRMGEIAEAIK